ncbi:MAG TPA: hypothetical protein VH913_12220 [Hyphomicrobiaceae bacterium]
MLIRYSSIALLLTVGALSQACANRETDVAGLDKRLERITMQDQPLDCATIFAEVKANIQTISDLARQQNAKLTQRTFWYGKNLQGAEGKEIQALQSRQQYLVTLAQHNGCGAQPKNS